MECPLLREYAKREGIPDDELERFGADWPVFVRDYAFSHGPWLKKDERHEYAAWLIEHQHCDSYDCRRGEETKT